MSRTITALFAAAALLGSVSLAQAQSATPPQELKSETPASGGLGPEAKQPAQVDKGQNMILPSAGSAGQSAAPTMVFDCKAKPQDCTTAPTTGDKATAPTLSTKP